MWDFDGQPLNQVAIALRRVQLSEVLPTIHIYQTSPGDYYAARCLHATNWWDCKRIVANTVGVDESYFRFGVYREHFTIRVGPKHGRYLQLIKVLDSGIPANMTEKDLQSWTVYETLARPHKDGHTA